MVTDEMVETSMRIWFGNYDEMDEADKATYRVPMREILSFITFSQPKPSVAVKALEWVKYREDGVTQEGFGKERLYHLRSVNQMGLVYFVMEKDGLFSLQNPEDGYFSSAEAAKAAAQADYEAQIRSALA